MKKLLFITTILSLSFTQMNAQSEKGMFFSLSGGYNFASGSQIEGSNSSRTQIGSSPIITTEENIKGSYGKGINVGVAIGYMFNKNIGTELGVNYLIGGDITSTSSFKSNNTFFNSSNSSSKKFSAKSLQFRPTFILTAGMTKINPYSKFGLLISKNTLKIESSGSSTSASTFSGNTRFSSNESSVKLDGGISFGFHAALGLSYSLNNNISIFGELNMVNMSYAPTKGIVTAATQDGVDVLSLLDVNDKEIEFVDSTSSLDPVTAFTPSKELKKQYAFGSFGINFGIKYSL